MTRWDVARVEVSADLHHLRPEILKKGVIATIMKRDPRQIWIFSRLR